MSITKKDVAFGRNIPGFHGQVLIGLELVLKDSFIMKEDLISKLCEELYPINNLS